MVGPAETQLLLLLILPLRCAIAGKVVDALRGEKLVGGAVLSDLRNGLFHNGLRASESGALVAATVTTQKPLANPLNGLRFLRSQRARRIAGIAAPLDQHQFAFRQRQMSASVARIGVTVAGLKAETVGRREAIYLLYEQREARRCQLALESQFR